MNIFKKENGNRVVENNQNNLKKTPEEIKISELKNKRLDLDLEIRDLENKLKDAEHSDVENLTKIISGWYIELDAITEEIKKLHASMNPLEAKSNSQMVTEEDPFARDQNIVRISKREDR